LVVLIGLCPLIDWRKISPARLARNLWVQAVVALITAVILALFLPQQIWAIVSFTVSAFVITTIVLQLAQGVVARMRSAGENVLVAIGRAVGNNRRRYGGQLIHFSILLIVIGITGSQAYQEEVTVALAKGESVDVQGYTLSYQDYIYRQIEEEGNKVLNEAVVDVYRGDRRVATVRPKRNLHSNVESPVTEVALRTSLVEDLYVVLAGLEADGLAAFQVIINPMVVWLWIGGLVMIVGTLIAAWPARRPRQKAQER